MGKYWTKKEAVRVFMEDVLPAVIARYGHGDGAAVREAWNNTVDSWIDGGCVSKRAYDWTFPRELSRWA